MVSYKFYYMVSYKFITWCLTSFITWCLTCFITWCLTSFITWYLTSFITWDITSLNGVFQCLKWCTTSFATVLPIQTFEIQRGSEYSVCIEADGRDKSQLITHTVKDLKSGETRTVHTQRVDAPGTIEQCVVIDRDASKAKNAVE